MPHTSAAARTSQIIALTGDTFLPSFLGLAATRVWLQVNPFASYTQSDDGLFTVVNNFAYDLVMVIGAVEILAVASVLPASVARWAAACERRPTCGWACANQCCTGSCRWPSDPSAAWC